MKFIIKNFCAIAVMTIIFFGNTYIASAQYPGSSGTPIQYPGSSGGVQYPGSSGTPIQYPGSSGGVQYSGSSGCAGYFCFQNPLKVSTICGLIQKLLTALLVLGTPIAVLALVYAGFMFVLARGNAEKLVHAQKNLVYVLMGIAIFFGSWVLGQVIANTINTIKPGTVNSSNSCN